MENLSSWIIVRRLRWPFLVIVLTFSISILGMVLIPGQDDQGNVYHLNFFDAFYFVSYMASTIGFGESPYAFTYAQKLWVSFNIYLTVVGWFYGIGTIIALMQDEVLHKELSGARFRKAVKNIKEPFVLILGYNNTTKELIQKLSKTSIRMVVLDKDQQAINALILENYQPHIPAYSGDVFDNKILTIAGIHKKNCHSVVMLFENDKKNTKLSLICKHLNKHVKLIVRSDSIQNSDFLKTIGVDYVENPFTVIADRFYLSLTSPHLWLLEMWIHGHILKIKRREIVPQGYYVIYGYGRMGQALEKNLKKVGVTYSFIDAREEPEHHLPLDQNTLFSEDEIEDKLVAADIQNAALIIAATRDDLINLAVITLAKKYNPDIYTISRENEMNGIHMFQAARVQRHYPIERILIEKTYNYIAMPLANIFVNTLNQHDEQWGEQLVNRIISKMGERPMLYEIEINEETAYAVYHQLEKNISISLGMLKRKREDYTQENKLIFLMVLRNEMPYMLPENNYDIKVGDKLLIICDEKSKEDLAYILENYYELYYVMHGKESSPGLLSHFLA